MKNNKPHFPVLPLNRSAPPRFSPSVESLAASMLYEYRLDELGKEFAARNLAPVIVKGQAIVDLAYPKDEIRLADDVDLLVGDDCECIATVLKELGYKEKAGPSRHYKFGDRVFSQSGTRLPNYVELHRCLDKFLIRPIPYAEILTRAKPSARKGFRYPTIEDLFLLVVLHASADNQFDPERVERDLWFLINHGKPDLSLIGLRARKWELTRALRRLSNGQYPKSKIRPLGPAAYLSAQLLWHENPITVLCGLAEYSYARWLDRFFP